MNEQNLIKNLNRIKTGDSYLAEKELPLVGSVVLTTGVPVGAATAPTAVADGISFDDGDTAFIRFTIPQDYDQDGDRCALRLTEVPSADSSDTTDLGITTAQSIYRAGAAEDTTTSTATAESATASTGQLVRENVLTISSRGFQPGDVVTLTLDGNNSGTTEIILTGASLIYGSTLAAYNDDDRDRDMT
jgi:hypothetical protein